MPASRPASAGRSRLLRTAAPSLVVTASAGLCLAAASLAGPLDLGGWTLFDPDNDWTFSHPTATSVRMTEQVGSASVHPGWVVSDFILAPAANVEFDLAVAAGTGDDDLIGFGFSWLDGSHSWLLDWKKSTQSFNWGQTVPVNDDIAEQGLKIKRINGSYSWDGLWGGQDGAGVTTIAGPTGGAWVAGTVYHFAMQLGPGHIVVTRDGLPLFDVLDPGYPGAVGAITCYSFSQTNLTLSNVSISPLPWINLGLGKPGTAGVPLLDGTDTLSGGSPNQLFLTKAKPSSPAMLFVGLSAINAPFKGGTLVPQPTVLAPLSTNPAGAQSLLFTWPTGVPMGLPVYFQFWIQDAGAAQGFSASNGLKGVTS